MSEYYTWYPLEKFPNSIYEINKMGQIRNTKTSKVLKGSKDLNGYKSYTLYYDKKAQYALAHVLVANQFLQIPENLRGKNIVINHIDEDKMNPCIDNLEWVTKKQNLNYGTVQKRRSEKLEKPINEYTVEGKYVRTWKSATRIAQYVLQEKDVHESNVYIHLVKVIKSNDFESQKKVTCNRVFMRYIGETEDIKINDIHYMRKSERSIKELYDFWDDMVVDKYYLFDGNERVEKYKEVLKQYANDSGGNIVVKEAFDYALQCMEKISQIKAVVGTLPDTVKRL